MANSGTALGIIGIILAAGAIGFAFFVWNGQNTTNSDVDDLTDEIADLRSEHNDLESDFNNLSKSIIVGVWDGLSHNTDNSDFSTQRNWLFELEKNQVINSEYLSLSNSNTRITILKSGWYRIHLSALLSSILNGVAYSMRLQKNDELHSRYSYYIANGVYLHMDGIALIECNATDYIELNGFSAMDDFVVSTSDDYNRLTIEYVAV